ncbi:MAG: phytanoyl-CoA dioxygenase family protein [Candidatus Latescibacteria bacterium]|nr:phytanoyl-CoA dioxygenase family protein [Candidatus Latescibacterota bacterium]
MIFQEALYALGVREDTLSDEEKLTLDQDGFLFLPNLVPPDQVVRMRRAMDTLFVLEGTGEEDKPKECTNMQNTSPEFDICFTHPRLLAGVAHVLKGEFRSLGIHSRPNRPGGGHQPLHVDYGGPPVKPGEYVRCNSMWMLTDFTEENGATRVVLGTHRWGKHPPEVMNDPRDPHPEEITLIGTAGTVVIFNGHVWHGATLNRSQDDRPNVTSFWRSREQPGESRSSDWGVLDIETSHRLSEAARRLFC